MQPQQPVIPNPIDLPDTPPETEITNDPDIPAGTPVDDVFDPQIEDAPDVTD
jgi:hypothetical protein